jgi:outer membrane usher protein
MLWREKTAANQICFIVLGIVGILLPAFGYEAERVVVRVILNSDDKGDFFLLTTPERDVLFTPEQAEAIGFRKIPESARISVGATDYISLNALFPTVKYEIDERDVALRITVDPGLLEKQVIQTGRGFRETFALEKANSAYLNYGLRYHMGKGSDFRSFDIPLEANVNLWGYNGFCSASYTKNDSDERFRRFLTNVTRDYQPALRRVIFGDFTAGSGILGGGGIYGGLSVSTEFSIDPYLITFPGLDLSGASQTQSEVALYVNNRLVMTEQLGAGTFEILDIPWATGYGSSELLIRDAFGREEIISTPFYISTRLLRPGLHEYSYNIGFRRENFAEENFDYGEPAFLGFHRIGLSRVLTGGLRAEIDKDHINFGPTTTFLVGNKGEVDTSIALSYHDGRYGYAGLIGYRFAGRRFSTRFSLLGFSREYTNLSVTSTQNKRRLWGTVGLGYNVPFIGSLSGTFSVADYYTGEDIKRTSLFYTKRLWWDTSMTFMVSRHETDETVDEVSVTLTHYFGNRTSGNLQYTARDDKAVERVTIQQNPPRGTGFGYRLLADRAEDDSGKKEFRVGTSAQYRGPYGVYSAGYRRFTGQDWYDLGLSGAVACINKHLYLSRPIYDSFAVVKAGDVEGVRVYNSNQEVTRTNQRGEAIVPDLISYYGNALSIEDKDLPVNYDIKVRRKIVTTGFREGGVFNFGVTKLQAFVGNLFYLERGEKVPAQYAGLQVSVGEEKLEFVVGDGGEFYLENLPAGQYRAKVFSKNRVCNFDLRIPDSKDAMVDLGEIICEMD